MSELEKAMQSIELAAKRSDHFGCSLSPEEARALLAYVRELEEKIHE